MLFDASYHEFLVQVTNGLCCKLTKFVLQVINSLCCKLLNNFACNLLNSWFCKLPEFVLQVINGLCCKLLKVCFKSNKVFWNLKMSFYANLQMLFETKVSLTILLLPQTPNWVLFHFETDFNEKQRPKS